MCAGKGRIHARLVDIFPTALRLLGMEPRPGLDGRPLDAIAPGARPTAVPANPETSAAQKAYSPEEEEAICRRLEGLGYL